MAEDNAPDTIDLDTCCQEPDPLSAFAEEPPNQPHHATRPVPTVAGVAALAWSRWERSPH